MITDRVNATDAAPKTKASKPKRQPTVSITAASRAIKKTWGTADFEGAYRTVAAEDLNAAIRAANVALEALEARIGRPDTDAAGLAGLAAEVEDAAEELRQAFDGQFRTLVGLGMGTTLSA